MIASVLAFGVGVAVVAATLLSAVRTVVLPHGRPARLTGLLFVLVRRLLAVHERMPGGARRRHGVLSLYAPVTLMALPLLWLTGAVAGFTAMFWALGTRPWREAFRLAGSSMLTLGWIEVSDLPRTVVGFFAAALAISVLALLLVTYLPTMYQAYSSRERILTGLETFAGEPPDPATLLIRHFRIGALDRLDDIWIQWRNWFFEARETHTALPAVVLFRSSSPDREWVPAVGALLDAAALWNSVCVAGQDADASLCLRSGSLALNDIAEAFGLAATVDPRPEDPISVERSTFDELYQRLSEAGVPLTADPDQGWMDWAGWRVNYDVALRGLSSMTGSMSMDDRP